MGYNVQYITAGAVPQFAAIAQDEIQVQPEVWTNNVGEIYPKAVKSGDIVVLGELGLKPQEGWIYPPYMAEKCPGLPDYKALYDCAQAFATADTFPKGRLITYPADWGTRSKDVVAEIGLPFNPVAGGSEGAMVAELKSALESKSPILMMFWQPHWVFSQYKMDWVKWDPTKDGTCDEAKETKGNACGFQQASVDKVVNKNMAAKWPMAVEFLKKFTLTNDEQNKMIYEVDQQSKKLDDVVNEWIGANKNKWSAWVK